jgi:hypothetical protein
MELERVVERAQPKGADVTLRSYWHPLVAAHGETLRPRHGLRGRGTHIPANPSPACERASASERAASNGLRGRETQ